VQYGGGQAGFMACQQDVKLLQQFPTYMYGITKTKNPGEFGWGRAMNERCSHGSREKANEYFGTETGLWGITAGIYLASMGPQGMRDLATTILQNLAYLTAQLAKLKGVKIRFTGSGFQEVLVDFNGTGKTVRALNKALLRAKIFGGKDLSREFPELGQCALYCVSELTTVEQMDNLAAALKKITGRRA
jgi:glycine dehydrogenase subunit 1